MPKKSRKWQPMYGETFSTKGKASARGKRVATEHKKDHGHSIEVRPCKRKRKLIHKGHDWGLEFRRK